MLKQLVRNKKKVAVVIIAALSVILALLVIDFLHISAPAEVRKKIVSKGSVRAAWRFSIYLYGENNIALKSPHDIAIDRNEKIYVTNAEAGEIAVFDKFGKFERVFNGRKAANGRLHTPLGISINQENGDIAVADKRLGKVNVYDSSFKLKSSLVEVFPIKPLYYKSKLYVTTYQHISVYSDEGKLLNRWGTRGKKWGQFDSPNGITIANELIYVSDSNNHRVQALSERGDIVWVEGKPVESVYEKQRRFDLPAGIAADDSGYLYLVDMFDCSVRLLNKDGFEIANIGDFGTSDGLFRYPTSITYAGKNRFYIADKGNNRIQAVDIYVPEKEIVSVVESAKEGLFFSLEPILAYRGLIMGMLTLAIFALSFLLIGKKTGQAN